MDSSTSASVVKTALDKVFYQNFNGEMHPGYVSAESSSVFNQDTIDRAAVITEVYKGTGLWGLKAENADVPQATAKVGNQQTFSVTEYAQSVDISKNFFDDNMHGVYENMVKDMAVTGNVTKNQNAFAIYRGAFTTTLTNDGIALIEDLHVNQAGQTIDNELAAAAFSESTLNDGITGLVVQKAQDGTVRGSMPKTLLVPPKLFKLATEVTESTLRSGTANNDMNVYSTKYGINVATTPYFSLAAGGSDTAWILLGNNHSVTRWVRQGINTDLVPYQYQRNNAYIYKGSFRETSGAMDYVGVIGSLGA